ncbi:MAG: VWA domain-containing protein, partial [Chloroflexota bacterium]
GVVTFVMDTSGSMSGNKLEQAKKGTIKALEALQERNQAGFVTFSDRVQERVKVGPISRNRYDIAAAVQGANAAGGTALYDAIAAAMKMTDEADGPEDAIRGVVVLTDGAANSGMRLDQIIAMTSRLDDRRRVKCAGQERETTCQDDEGRTLQKTDVVANGLTVPTKHRIHIFFVGAGNDADIQVGRLLAEASGGTFVGVAEKDIERFLELFGKYF